MWQGVQDESTGSKAEVRNPTRRGSSRQRAEARRWPEQVQQEAPDEEDLCLGPEGREGGRRIAERRCGDPGKDTLWVEHLPLQGHGPAKPLACRRAGFCGVTRVPGCVVSPRHLRERGKKLPPNEPVTSSTARSWIYACPNGDGRRSRRWVERGGEKRNESGPSEQRERERAEEGRRARIWKKAECPGRDPVVQGRSHDEMEDPKSGDRCESRESERMGVVPKRDEKRNPRNARNESIPSGEDEAEPRSRRLCDVG